MSRMGGLNYFHLRKFRISYRKYVYLILVLSVLLLLFIKLTGFNDQLRDGGRQMEVGHPIAIWWTPFTPFKRITKTCSKGTCLFIHNRKEINNPLTEAVLFYGSDLSWKDLPLPRNEKLYWSLFHEESPKNNWGLSYTEGISLFNITATFSRHSSYPLVTMDLESIDQILTPLKYSTAQKSKGDLALVMYLHSDCGTPSDRDRYTAELMKYIKVDSCGGCLHNKELPKHLRDPLEGMDSLDLVEIVARYKFILTFENSICEDYITEKFWRGFQAGTVPVYKGSPSIMDWAPDSHSVILVTDFGSPKGLAEYLKYLDRNDSEYEKYLQYKKNGVTNERLLKHMKERDYYIHNAPGKRDMVDGFECTVCNTIHERKSIGRRPEPLIANQSHYNCQYPRPLIKRQRTKKWWKDEIVFWRQVASTEHHRVKAVAQAIASGGDSRNVNVAANVGDNMGKIPEFQLQDSDYIN